MDIERVAGGNCTPPFPVHEALADAFVAAHATPSAGRDATLAHALGVCAGFAYADTATVSLMMTRLGLESSACMRIAQTVDAMYVYSTAYLVQSRCGRVAILAYRGTETTNLGHWIGDGDVGSESSQLLTGTGQPLRVHAGFYRNLRLTRLAVIDALELALHGKSLLDPSQRLEHPLEALYVTGHSLGGAMAALFALTLGRDDRERALLARLRAIYTYGQPMAIGGPLTTAVDEVARRLHRHVLPRDPVPALPPTAWGHFAHFGHEYVYTDGQWAQSKAPVAQLESATGIPRALLAIFATEKRRASQALTAADHGPHQYLAALRPAGRVNELGD